MMASEALAGAADAIQAIKKEQRHEVIALLAARRHGPWMRSRPIDGIRQLAGYTFSRRAIQDRSTRLHSGKALKSWAGPSVAILQSTIGGAPLTLKGHGSLPAELLKLGPGRDRIYLGALRGRWRFSR